MMKKMRNKISSFSSKNLLTKPKKYGIMYTAKGKEKTKMKSKKLFRIHWDNGNQISCFFLKTRSQAESIAKQYPNVIKVEEVRD